MCVGGGGHGGAQGEASCHLTNLFTTAQGTYGQSTGLSSGLCRCVCTPNQDLNGTGQKKFKASLRTQDESSLRASAPLHAAFHAVTRFLIFDLTHLRSGYAGVGYYTGTGATTPYEYGCPAGTYGASTGLGSEACSGFWCVGRGASGMANY